MIVHVGIIHIQALGICRGACILQNVWLICITGYLEAKDSGRHNFMPIIKRTCQQVARVSSDVAFLNPFDGTLNNCYLISSMPAYNWLLSEDIKLSGGATSHHYNPSFTASCSYLISVLAARLMLLRAEL